MLSRLSEHFKSVTNETRQDKTNKYLFKSINGRGNGIKVHKSRAFVWWAATHAAYSTHSGSTYVLSLMAYIVIVHFLWNSILHR